jgi:hypothetical protein
MDTSKLYGIMCHTAKEIQDMRADYYEGGDFYLIHGVYDVERPLYNTASYNENGTKQQRSFNEIWLPRLDQLADMWENWNHAYSFCFFAEMEVNSRFHPIKITNNDYVQLSFDTLEKHVLHRLMWGKYHKIWDVKKLAWYTNAERETPEQKAENERQQAEWEQRFKDNRMDEI